MTEKTTTQTTRPDVTSLTIPSRIDVTSGPAAFEISASATDDLAGVGEMVIWLDDEIAYSFSPSSTTYSAYPLLGFYDSEDWADGSATEDWSLAPTNASGVVNVTRVTIEDMQGNSRDYQAEELASMGVNTQIEIVGATPDTMPPDLTSLTIPSRIDVTSGPAAFEISASATDDLAGVGEMVIWLDDEIAYSFSPSSTTYSAYPLLGFYDSEDWADGSATEDWSLAPTNASGVVNVTRVTIEDMQGNSRDYQAEELASMGVNTQIEIVGAEGPAPRASLVANQDHRGFELALVADAPLDTPTLDIDVTFSTSGGSFNEVFLYGSGALSQSSSSVNGTSSVSLSASLPGSFADGDRLVGFDFDVETAGSVSVASISVRIDGQSYLVEPADFDLVEPPNPPPYGVVAIIGEIEQGAALTADTSGLSDPDGLGAFSYLWLRNGLEIAGATSETYTLTQDDVGSVIAVQVSFEDGLGEQESVTSSPPEQILLPITQTSTAGGNSSVQLTFEVDVADQRGLIQFSYGVDGWAYDSTTASSEWSQAGLDASDVAARVLSYVPDTLTPQVVGPDNLYTEFASFFSDLGEIALYDEVSNVNDDPTGSVAITGTVSQGETLTADTSGLDDPDGLGTFSYQWLRDGTDISGATSSSYKLTQDDVGTQISVEVSYTDGFGRTEYITSDPTAPVTEAPNADPTGDVLINGTATEGSTLTADASGLSDDDGLGSFSYAWLRDGTPIAGVTGSSHALTQADVGSEISVRVSYTDGRGTDESVTSAATVPVTVEAPNRAPTIASIAAQTVDENIAVGATVLTASASDPDGDALTFSLGGPDAGAFDVDAASGEITLAASPDHEAPADADGNNDYELTVTAADPDGAEASESFTVEVRDVNEAPQASDDSGRTPRDTAVTLTAAELTGNDADPDGDALAIASVGNTGNGTAVLNADGTVTFTPDAGFAGPAGFDYTVSDGRGGSATASVAVTVEATNRAPRALADSYATGPGQAMNVNATRGVLSNDSDPDGDDLSISNVEPSALGTLEMQADGAFTFTPNPKASGRETLTYTVSDGTEATQGSLELIVTDGKEHEVAGLIKTHNGDGLAGTKVSFRADDASSQAIESTAGSDGSFTLLLDDGMSGHLDAMRDHDPADDPAIGVSDALNVLRIAVGLDPSWGSADAFDFISADVDQSGDVGVFDALEVLRHAVGLETENAPKWVFIDDDADVSHITSGNVAYDTGIDLAEIDADIQPLMTGLLLGNMEDYA